VFITLRHQITKKEIIALLLVGLFVLSLPGWIDPYIQNVFIMIFIYGALGSAWNLIGGYGGQTSLGHAAFFGIGAYAPAILVVKFGLSPWLGLFVGIICSVILSLAIGAICFRLRGHYFAIATMILLEVTRLLCLRERWLTGGGVGLSIPYKGNSLYWFQFDAKGAYFYASLVILLLVLFVNYKVSVSKIGYLLKAIGQNEDAAEVIGVDSANVKRNILVLSAALTSVCGTFWVQYMYFIDPDMAFSGAFSIEIALVAIIGGMGTVFGPLFGALLLRPMVEITSSLLGDSFAGVHLILYSVILLLVVIFRPSGIFSYLSDWYKKFKLKNV